MISAHTEYCNFSKRLKSWRDVPRGTFSLSTWPGSRVRSFLAALGATILSASLASANPAIVQIGAALDQQGEAITTIATDTRQGFRQVNGRFREVRNGFHRTEQTLRDNRGLIAASAALGLIEYGSGDGLFFGASAAGETVDGQAAGALGLTYRSGRTTFTLGGASDQKGRAVFGVGFSVRLR